MSHELREQLAHVLDSTDFNFLGEKYEGKVRDSYINGDTRFLITTDRLSCFDVVVTTVPLKGQVLNQLAVHWFEKSSDIVENHLLDVPDPNVMVVKNCEILPVEVVVRGYLTGSAWRAYQSGKDVSGITLPAGMRESQAFEKPLITPSTKAERGSHDEPISEKDLVQRGLVNPRLWEQVREVSFALFEKGQRFAESQSLILVDTKYEFGLYEDRLMLVDEIHTLDSSRYWVKESYEELFESGQTQRMLDKEPTRQWLLSQGYQGDGPVPTFSDEHRLAISKHYMDSFEQLSGKSFEPIFGPTKDRIEAVLRKYSSY